MGFMKDRKTGNSAHPVETAVVALEKAEKGANFSMWELLLQLRVLLPYLTRLAPLLERTGRGSTDLSELSRGVAGIHTGNRELEALTRNQTVQLDRLEEQLARVEAAHQNSLEECRSFFGEMRAFRLWMIRMTLVIVLLIGSTAGMVLYLLLRS